MIFVHGPFHFLAAFSKVFMKCHVSINVGISKEMRSQLSFKDRERERETVKEGDKRVWGCIDTFLKPLPHFTGALFISSVLQSFKARGYKKTTMYYLFYSARHAVSLLN